MSVDLLSGIGLGAGLSGILAFVGVVYTQRRHEQRERANWYREKRFETLRDVLRAMATYDTAYLNRDKTRARKAVDDFVVALGQLEGLADELLVREFSHVCHEHLRGVSANEGDSDETLVLALEANRMMPNILENKALPPEMAERVRTNLRASQRRDLPILWPQPDRQGSESSE